MSSDTQPAAKPSYVLGRAEVRRVDIISPSFVRITFGGEELADFGTPGDVYDARIKVIFPAASGALPALRRDSHDWWNDFLALPEDERGSVRTYSIRDLVVTDDATEVVVDFVLHLEPGLTGPASTWASQAAAGQEAFLVGPRRGRQERGGIEYDRGDRERILLAGDETAAPAIARILEDSAPDTRGIAFIEIPVAEDILDITAPEGVSVHWLPRAGAAHGLRLIPTVLDYLGDAPTSEISVTDVDGEDLLWETPDYSGLGEEIASGRAADDRYYWIAGESGVVTTLRRHLVKDLGIDRSQVAFMGYWRKGVAMRG